MVAGAKRRGTHTHTHRCVDVTGCCSWIWLARAVASPSELKEAQRKKRQMKERHRQEDSISNAMVIWNTEILPHWDSMYVSTAVCVCVCARVLVFIYIVCVQEGNEAGQRAVVAGPPPQRQRKSLEPRYRQRAEHHSRYKHAILDSLLTLMLNIKYIFKCCSDCSCLFKPPRVPQERLSVLSYMERWRRAESV